MASSLTASIGGLVLAAGKGTRMHSATPKVLHDVLGEPMLWHVLEAMRPLLGERIWTVLGFGADQALKAMPDLTGRHVLQERQLGTGHALQTAWPRLEEEGFTHVLVVNGDTPLIPAAVLAHLVDASLRRAAAVAFLSVTLSDPAGFGRVVRDDRGELAAIVEQKDFDPAIHGAATGEINAGIYCLDLRQVEELLSQLSNANKSGEYYITDLVALAKDRGRNIMAVNAAEAGLAPGQSIDCLGVNSPAELVAAEEHLRGEIVSRWAARHVLLRNPLHVRIGPRVLLEPGAEVHGFTELLGATRVAAGARIMSHCWIKDCVLEAGAVIQPFSHCEQAHVGPGAVAGPYARLRPGAIMEEDSRVGNFVEMKKARLGKKAKASHLTYLGDADIGPGANIGAGTITCNYDGKNKFKTTVGAGAFIGSNAALVAPVTVGEGALVGAGSVITEDVPAGALALGRGKQVNKTRKSTP